MTAPNGHDPALAEHVARALGAAVASGSGWTCRCPCHDDGTASLSVSTGDKQPLLVHCHAGCDGKAVLAEIGRRGLTPKRERERQAPGRRIVAACSYTDERGAVLYQAVRFEPKDFKQRQPDGAGGWRWTMAGVRHVLYHLPAVIASDEVLVVEGEKDADNLAKLGLVATTNIGGAEGKDGKSKWRPEYAQALKGKHVLILPDNDPPGRRHARVVAASLAGLAASVRVLELPGLPEKGDVSDWLAKGGTLEQLKALARDAPAREDWTAKQDESEPLRVTRPRDAPAREDWTAGLVRKGKHPTAGEANVILALREAPELAGRVRLNELTGRPEGRDLPWRKRDAWAPWRNSDGTMLAAWLQRNAVHAGPPTCNHAVEAVAEDNPHHPVRAWLEGLRWEGTPRLDGWLQHYLGAAPAGETTEEKTASAAYLRAVGRKWLITLVARAYQPGCKADCMLILEGGQGVGKSRALAALMRDRDWFADGIANLNTKDAAQDLPGKWLIEMAELSAMPRAEIEKIKAFLSRYRDHYRPSFGHFSQDYDRHGCLAGTTNAHAYLLDETGNRRFWPVRVGAIRLDALLDDRDQLWAEAVHAFKAGEHWWLDEDIELIAAKEQAKRLEDDPWTEDVLKFAELQEGREFSVDQLMRSQDGLQLFDAAKRDGRAAVKIARILKIHGYTSRHTERGNRWKRAEPPRATPSAMGSGLTP